MFIKSRSRWDSLKPSSSGSKRDFSLGVTNPSVPSVARISKYRALVLYSRQAKRGRLVMLEESKGTNAQDA
jgi:hypothetical protein